MPAVGDPDSSGKYTVIRASANSTTFFLSLPPNSVPSDIPDKFQLFGTPHARALKGPSGKVIAAPQLEGDASWGGQLESGQRLEMTVQYHCMHPGVTPVLVVIPLKPLDRGSISFRLVKVCGTSKQWESVKSVKSEFYWTAGRLIVVGIVGVLFLTGFIVKRCYCPSKSQKYSKIGSSGVADRNFQDPVDSSVEMGSVGNSAGSSARFDLKI
mmetsp:Transcript_4098/g.6338  ORF Transcript_4098/g.6338 Transcript_4098/m.6338 type:complete len:212 (+) Transcript_4098:696-1331(+)